jgi:hypothetical protein
MNKSKAVFLFILFVGFGFLGYLIMNGVKELFSTTNITTTDAIPLSGKQQNFIIIHVDDLSAETPKLVSVWAVFFYPSESPSLTFKELYPHHPTPNQLDEKFAATFMLSEKGQISNKLIKQLDAYQFQWSGYVLIDHQAINYISKWLQIQNIPISLQQAIQIPGATVMPEDEIEWYNQVCSQIEWLDLQTTKNIPWSDMIPLHMHSTMLFDQLVTIWDYLARSDIPPHCEVINP